MIPSYIYLIININPYHNTLLTPYFIFAIILYFLNKNTFYYVIHVLLLIFLYLNPVFIFAFVTI